MTPEQIIEKIRATLTRAVQISASKFDADVNRLAVSALCDTGEALAALRAPTAPPDELVAQLRAKIEEMPTREEWLGGQRTKYLNRDEVLGWFDNPPALGTPPVDGKPEPGSREWWREVAQGLGVKANMLQRALELMLEAYEAHDSWCGNKAGSPGNSLHWMAANAARNALGVERTKQPYRAPALGTPLAAEADTERHGYGCPNDGDEMSPDENCVHCCRHGWVAGVRGKPCPRCYPPPAAPPQEKADDA